MRREQPTSGQPVFGVAAPAPSTDTLSRQDDSGRQAPRRLGRRALAAQALAAAQAGNIEGAAGEHKSLTTTHLPKHVPTSARRIEQRLTVTARQTIPIGNPLRPRYLALPGARAARKRSYSGYIGFAVCVGIPVLLASIYYGFFASNQYAAEFRFAVQDNTPASSAIPSSLTAVLGGGAGGVTNDNYIVTDYLLSRSAVDELEKRINVIGKYAKPTIDWWGRYDATKPIEKFVPYWQSMVAANFDQVTGLATVTIRAFSAQDALLIADTMVKLSEELVNQLAGRSQTDAVRFAQKEVERAQDRLKADRVKMTEFRSRVGVIDPTTSVTVSNSTLVTTQRASLASLETQLATYVRQNLAPNSPVVVTLKNQIKSVKEQLAATEADVGRGANGTSLSKIVGEYEQLNLQVQFAQAMVTSTMQALDQARANAAAQHLYITPYVRPSLPQSPQYPNRPLAVATVGLIAFALWAIGLLILRSIRERFA